MNWDIFWLAFWNGFTIIALCITNSITNDRIDMLIEELERADLTKESGLPRRAHEVRKMCRYDN